MLLISPYWIKLTAKIRKDVWDFGLWPVIIEQGWVKLEGKWLPFITHKPLEMGLTPVSVLTEKTHQYIIKPSPASNDWLINTQINIWLEQTYFTISM